MKGGFTLVEVLLVLGIGAVLGAFLIGILVSTNGIFYQQNSIVSQGLGLNDSIVQIENHTREALLIPAVYPDVSPIYTTGINTLILKLPAYNDSGILNGVFDYVVIYKDSVKQNLLILKVFPDASSTRPAENRVLLTNLNNVLFEYLDLNDNPVNSQSAVKVKGTITVLSKTGSIGSPQSAIFVSSFRNL